MTLKTKMRLRQNDEKNILRSSVNSAKFIIKFNETYTRK